MSPMKAHFFNSKASLFVSMIAAVNKKTTLAPGGRKRGGSTVYGGFLRESCTTLSPPPLEGNVCVYYRLCKLQFPQPSGKRASLAGSYWGSLKWRLTSLIIRQTESLPNTPHLSKAERWLLLPWYNGLQVQFNDLNIKRKTHLCASGGWGGQAGFFFFFFAKNKNQWKETFYLFIWIVLGSSDFFQ